MQKHGESTSFPVDRRCRTLLTPGRECKCASGIVDVGARGGGPVADLEAGIPERSCQPVAERSRAALAQLDDEIGHAWSRGAAEPSEQDDGQRAERCLVGEQRRIRSIAAGEREACRCTPREHEAQRRRCLQRDAAFASCSPCRDGVSMSRDGDEGDGEDDRDPLAPPDRGRERSGVPDSDCDDVEPSPWPPAGIRKHEMDEQAPVHVEGRVVEVAEEPGEAGDGEQRRRTARVS